MAKQGLKISDTRPAGEVDEEKSADEPGKAAKAGNAAEKAGAYRPGSAKAEFCAGESARIEAAF